MGSLDLIFKNSLKNEYYYLVTFLFIIIAIAKCSLQFLYVISYEEAVKTTFPNFNPLGSLFKISFFF